MYEWELQSAACGICISSSGWRQRSSGAWAFEYVAALRELGASWCFGFVDSKPLHSPQPAEVRVAT